MIQNILILLATAALANMVGRAVSQFGVPDFIGFILTGLIVGPTGLNLVDYQERTVGPLWNLASDVGLVALMVAAGLGMSDHLSNKQTKRVAVLSGATFICLAPAFLSATWIMDFGFDPAVSGAASAKLAYQITLALAVIVTSVPFITKILANNGLLETPFATTVLCTACLVDLVVWTVVPLVLDLKEGVKSNSLALATPGLMTVLMLGCMATFVYLVTRFSPKLGETGESIVVSVRIALLALIPVLFVETLDVSLMIAALGFGLSLGYLGLPFAAGKNPIRRVSTYLFIPVFFASVGLKLQLNGNLAPALVIGFLLWSTILKMTFIFAATLVMRMSMVESMSYAFALNTRGGPGIVLATITFNAGVIGSATFVAFVCASIVTALLANMVLRIVVKRQSFSNLRTSPDVLKTFPPAA